MLDFMIGGRTAPAETASMLETETRPTILTIDGTRFQTTVLRHDTATFTADLEEGEVYAFLGYAPFDASIARSGAGYVYAFNAKIFGPDREAISSTYVNFFEPTLGSFPCFGGIYFTAPQTGPYTISIFGTNLHRSMTIEISLQSAQAFSSMWNGANLASPTLRALWEKDLLAPGTVEAYYESRMGLGPLVEDYPGDPDFAYVTFLYKGDESLRLVTLASGPTTYATPMQRFGDSHIYTLTRRVPKDAYFQYSFHTNRKLSIAGELPFFQADPATNTYETDPLSACGSVMILSDAVIAKETRPTSAPKGRILTEKLHSDILGGGRTYHVYLPSDFEEDRQLPLLVALDGESMLGPAASVPLPTILDNLIATKRIPRMAAILVESTTERARDLISSHAYADFLVKELLPKVRGAYGVTSDPTRTILAGYSFGGLQAAYSSLLYSRTFGNALCLSPSFWANPEVSQDLDFYRENLVQPMLMDSNVRSSGVRFFLTYGIFESLIQLPTRHIRDMLKLNGMFVDWREYPANHCCLSWSNGFVDGLISLAGGW